MTTRKVEEPAGRSPFGELLVSLRTRQGLTQERLAQATEGDRISSRSITNYERSAKSAKDWVLPHRTGLRLLINAMKLDVVDQHALVTAWNKARHLRDAASVESAKTEQSTFIEAGRETALQNIMNAWNTAQNGEPQIVFLGGGSGTGKSALAHHISDRIAASAKNVMIAWGGASSWATEVEPYLSIRSATNRILEAPEPASSLPGDYPSRPTLSPQNVARIVESIPLLAGALISEHAIRGMTAGANDDLASTVREQLASRTSTEAIGRFEEYGRLLVHLSKSWPIVLVLDDMHWAGDPTATLLLHLVRRLQGMRDTPILIICVYRHDEVRPAGQGGGHPFSRLRDSIGHEPHVSNITLNDSMSPKAGMAYIRGVIDRTPMVNTDNANQLAEWMYEQTSGHPLLTGEMMRHLIETRALSEQKDSRWKFDSSRIPENPPSAISNFFEHRLNRVDHQARRILDIAAAMDDVILTAVVAEIMQEPEADVVEVIDAELVDTHQLLVPGAPVRLKRQAHMSFRFSHGLFREYVYNKVTSTRRRKLHFDIAQAMEQLFTEPDTTTLSEISSHYILAEDWHSAQMAGYRLAQHAVINLDWDLAEVWFHQAEDLAIQAQDPMQLWRTRAARLAMLRGIGQYDIGIEDGERILKLGEVHHWPATLALTYHHLGEIYYDLGMVDKSVEYLQKALALHLEEKSLDLAAAGYAMISHATYRQGKYDIAHENALAALNLSRQLTNSWVMPEAVLAAANCEIDLGYYDEAIRNYQLATELAVMVGKLHNQFIPRMNIGLSYVFMRDYKTAINVLTELIDHMESLTIDRLTAPARLYLGYALEADGQLDAAAASYAVAEKIRRGTMPPPTLYDVVAGQMRVALLQKDDKAAREWLLELTTHLEKHGWEGIEDPLLVMTSVGKASRHFGDEHAYRKYIERAHDLMMSRAKMIENEDSRTSYLTNVPINIELQELYADLKN